MIRKTDEQLILDSLSPRLLHQYVIFEDVKSLYLIKKDRKRWIEEMDIHNENVKKSGGVIIGYPSLQKSLSISSDEKVCILSGYDKKYGFDLYLNELITQAIGVAIVKIRKKSKEELKWERDVLGLKHP